jgi:hypothetical protein
VHAAQKRHFVSSWSLARRRCTAKSSARRFGATFRSSNPQFMQAAVSVSFSAWHSGQRIGVATATVLPLL